MSWLFLLVFGTIFISAIVLGIIVVVHVVKDKQSRRNLLVFLIPWGVITIGLMIYNLFDGERDRLLLVIKSVLPGAVFSLPIMLIVAIRQQKNEKNPPDQSPGG